MFLDVFVSIRNGLNIGGEVKVGRVRLSWNEYFRCCSRNISLLEGAISEMGRLRRKILLGYMIVELQMVDRYMVLSLWRKGC